MEDALEEVDVLRAVDLEHAQRRPGVHGRVDVAEGPLVGGQLAVRVHVPLAAEQDQLRLRELGVDVRERDAVEREVPGGVPRVLPRVRHRDHVEVVQVPPLVVAALQRAARAAAGSPGRRRASARRRSGRTASTRASRRTPAEARAPRRRTRRRASAPRRTRPPRVRARPSPRRSRRRARPSCHGDGARRSRSRPRRARAGSGRPPSCRSAPGLTVAVPWTTWSSIPSFG